MANSDAHIYEPSAGLGLAHDPFNSIVGLRSIGWISTVDLKSRRTLAPHSFFNALNYSPRSLFCVDRLEGHSRQRPRYRRICQESDDRTAWRERTCSTTRSLGPTPLDSNHRHRRVIRRTRPMLEEQGLLKRIGVIVHPRAGDGLPAAFFDHEGLVMGYAFGPAYEAAEKFSELYAARCPGAGFLKTILLRRIGPSAKAGLETARRLLKRIDWTVIPEDVSVSAGAKTRTVARFLESTA